MRDMYVCVIENLLTNADADKTYVRHWCQQLQLETFGIKI